VTHKVRIILHATFEYYVAFKGALVHHLPYVITQCYLPPNTDECSLPQPQPALDLSTPEG